MAEKLLILEPFLRYARLMGYLLGFPYDRMSGRTPNQPWLDQKSAARYYLPPWMCSWCSPPHDFTMATAFLAICYTFGCTVTDWVECYILALTSAHSDIMTLS